MALAQDRRIDAILVTELTRWGRSTTDLVQTLQNLQDWNVSLIAQTGLQFDLSTPQGKLIASMMAALAEFERDLLRERVRSGIAAAKARGNRRLVELGQARVNHKRVYWIMRLHGLLLARHTGNRPERSHEGKVITLRRNLRWSADAFEIGCWSDEKVRVPFALDCCDREVMGFTASTYGISGSMVRDLMLECVEKRFGTSLCGRRCRKQYKQQVAVATQGARQGQGVVHPGSVVAARNLTPWNGTRDAEGGGWTICGFSCKFKKNFKIFY